MKLSLSIKIFTIFVILHQITCAIPAGYVVTKNLTGTTAAGIYKLGYYPLGGQVAIKSLVNEYVYFYVYQNTYDMFEDYNGYTVVNSLTLEPLQTMPIQLLSSENNYYLRLADRQMPKFTL